MLPRLFSLSLALLTALPLATHAEVTGLSAGQFRVDETGSATYNMPINTPAGTAGMTPSISLSYTSSNLAEGPMGVGWSVAGLSAITRCPQTPIDDNGHIQAVEYTSEDKFCLDGQRLLLKSGSYGAPDSTYRTAIDNFSTITAKQGSSSNGPVYFEVKNKAGETHYYGNSAAISSAFSNHSDAFVEPGGFTAGVLARSWAIKVIKDRKNNYQLFNYNKDTSAGSLYISNIQYSGNLSTGAAPYAQINFIYAEHDKGFKGYMAGGHLYQDQRLQRIDTKVDNDVYRSYFLNYENSSFIEERTLLTSVQECPDNDSNMSNCLTPTTFDWQRPALATSGTTWVCESEPGMENFCWEQPTTSNYKPFPSSRTLATSTANRDTTQVIDINGDGYQDLVYVNGSSWYTKLGPYHTTAYYLSGIGDGKKEYAMSIDYNGDGVRDLLVADSKTSNWYAISYQPSQSTSTICPPGEPCEEYTTTSYKTVKNLGIVATGLEGEAQVLDVNGDGMEDIVFRTGSYLKAHINDGDGTFTANQILYTFSSSVSSSTLNDGYTSQTANMKSASAIDINGDGRSDLIIRVTTTTGGCYVNGRLFKFVSGSSECRHDIGGTWSTSTSTSYQLFVASGDATAPKLSYLQTIGSSSLNTLRVADLNGDGLSDLLYVVSDRWYYRLSDGTQLLAARDAGLVTSSSKKYLSQFIDLNGDGRTDILHATGTSTWYAYFSRPTTTGEWISFQNRGPMSFDSNAAIRFGDTTGDGKVNLLTATSGTWKEYYNRLNIKEYAINSITNSNGVSTDITYKPMTNSSVYVFQASDADINSDTFSPISGRQLVSRVSKDSNVGASIAVDYQYGGLLIHKKGRGSLGFQMLRTTDVQSGVITESHYNQQHDSTNFAKAKLPIYTERRLNGKLLSKATNTLAIKSTAQGSVIPYVSRSDESSYVYGSDGVSTLTSTTVNTNTYDSWGNLTNNTATTTDAANSAYQTITTVNNYGTAAEQQYGLLKSTSITKNATGDSGNPARQNTFSYNSDGLLSTSIVSPSASATKLTTSYSYDSYGNKTSISVSGYSTATGSTQTRTNHSVFDSRGRFINYTQNAMGERNTFLYNGLSASSFTGTLTSSKQTNPNGLATINYYDGFGQVTSINHPDSRSTTVSRSFCSNCVPNAHYKVLTTVSGSPQKAVYFDRWDREVGSQQQGFNGSWITAKTTYDSRGREWKTYEPGASVSTDLSYDVLNRVSQINKANGGLITQQIYGLESRTINELNQTSKVFHNGFGATEHTEDPLGNRVTFKYDAYGNVIETTTRAHGKDSKVTMVFDNWGRKTQTNDPIKGVWHYTYNAFGELASQKTARNQTFSFSYDLAGRRIRSYEASEGTLCWNYGSTAQAGSKAAGKLTSTAKYAGSSASCSTTASAAIKKFINYDSLGRPSNTTTLINNSGYSQSQSYDSYSRPLVTTYPNGTSAFAVKNIYNSYGYMKEVRNNATNALLKRVDSMTARGQVATETLGNGVVSTRSYQSDTGWLSYVDVKKGSVLKQYIATDYDTAGNVKSRTSQYGSGSSSQYTENYSYDGMNRLNNRSISVTAGSASLPTAFKSSQTYSLDNWGNFTYKSGAGYYKYDASKVHKLLGVYSNSNFTGTLYSFSYDSNGNVTSDGNRSFTYGSYDKPTSISQSGASSLMSYGVDRELYYKEDSYLEGGKNVTYKTSYLGRYEKVVRSGGAGALTEHKYYVGDIVYTQRSNASTETYYLHKDHQGSVVATTNAAGNVIAQAIYDPYGKRTAVYLDSAFANFSVSEVTDRGYTGHKHLKALDIIHMNGRIYDPTLGRFLQADPFIQAPKNPQSHNRYAYVVNNPMSYTDPSGYFFSGLKRFVKKYWKAIVAIAVTYFTAGAASSWAASWGFTTAVGNAVVAGAIAGAAGGFVGGALMTGSLKGALRGAFSGAIAGAAGGYANFGAVGGWGDAARRIGVAALGGCGAGKAAGGSCSKGAKMAAIAQALNVGMEKVSKSKPTWETAESEGVVKFKGDGVESATASNVGKSIEIVKGGKADHLIGRSLSSLTAEEAQLLINNNADNIGKIMIGKNTSAVSFSWDSEGSGMFTASAKNIPGMNSMAVFHDVWMAKWNAQNAILLGVTIVPALYINYEALGLNYHRHLNDSLED